MKKVIIAILIIVALLAISTAVYALTILKYIPIQCEIIKSPPDIQILSPQALNTPLNGVYFAIFQRGTTQTIDLFVKNSGLEPISVRVKTDPEIVTWANVKIAPYDFGLLNPNQTATMTLSVYALPTAATGNVTFSLVFYEP
jgi:hypothetical protein